MTPKTLTPAELDVLDAMLPDCNPPECTDAAMYDLDEEETRTARALFAIVNAAPALLSMARRLGDVTCQKCKRAFPHNEEMVCMCCNASLVSDACFYENRYVRVGDLTKQLTAATARADTAAARAQAAEKRCGESLISALTLMDDALDFIALVAGTTCTQGPTATHPDYCLKCRADALMRRAGRAR